MTCVFLLLSIPVKWIPECFKITEIIVLLEGGLLNRSAYPTCNYTHIQ